jgi:hypothetical protein
MAELTNARGYHGFQAVKIGEWHAQMGIMSHWNAQVRISGSVIKSKVQVIRLACSLELLLKFSLDEAALRSIHDGSASDMIVNTRLSLLMSSVARSLSDKAKRAARPAPPEGDVCKS